MRDYFEQSEDMPIAYAGNGVGLRTLLRPTRFTIPGAAAAQQEVTLIRNIPMVGAVSGSLVMRLHALSSTPSTGQRFQLVLQPFSLSQDAPDLEFATTTGEVAGQLIDSTVASTVAPILYVTALTAPIPPAFRLVSRITGATGSAVVVTVSVDLLGRAS